MKRHFFLNCIVLLLLAFLSASCSSDALSDEHEAVKADTQAVSSDNTAVCEESEATADVSLSEDYILLNDMGILGLIKSAEIWDYYLSGGFSYAEGQSPNTIRYNEEIYFELTVARDNQMAEIFGINQIENALGISFALNENENYYSCPFSSVTQIKESGKSVYSDEMIEKGYLAWQELIEYNGSIYAPDSGAGYISSYDDIANVLIIKQTDDNVEFEVDFHFSENDIAATTLYSVIYEDNHWVINDIM